jgi:hypothetical protein
VLAPAVVVGPRIVDIYDEFWRVIGAASSAPHVQALDFSLAGTIAWATRTPLTPVLRLSAAAIIFGWIIQFDGRRSRARTAQPFALYLLAIPLASPQSEIHHLAFMLPAAMVVAADVGANGQMTRSSATFRIATALALFLYLAGTAAPIAKGPLLCGALIALGVAVRSLKSEV